jgi:hypothetical protein
VKHNPAGEKRIFERFLPDSGMKRSELLQRSRAVIEQLLWRGPLPDEELRKLAMLRRVDDSFGIVMAFLLQIGWVERLSVNGERYFGIRSEVRRRAEGKIAA